MLRLTTIEIFIQKYDADKIQKQIDIYQLEILPWPVKFYVQLTSVVKINLLKRNMPSLGN